MSAHRAPIPIEPNRTQSRHAKGPRNEQHIRGTIKHSVRESYNRNAELKTDEPSVIHRSGARSNFGPPAPFSPFAPSGTAGEDPPTRTGFRKGRARGMRSREGGDRGSDRGSLGPSAGMDRRWRRRRRRRIPAPVGERFERRRSAAPAKPKMVNREKCTVLT